VEGSSASDAGLAGRYAQALFDLAKADGSLDRVADDLRGVRAMLADSPELRRSLASPMVPVDVKLATLKALGERAGLSPLTGKFLGVVATQSRLESLDGIAAAFLAQLAEVKGEMTVEVVSALLLEPGQEEAVRDVVGQSVGKAVRLETRVDPTLLAGMVVRVGSRMIDASLKTKLRNLELAMRGAG
jgi:F-type H+-transporting ATPase subunit delta